MTLRTYLFIGLVLGGCGKSDKDTPPAAANAPTPTGSASAPTPAPTPPAAPAVADVTACSLLTAAEVSAIFGKTLVATGSGHACTYGLDPVEKQKQMEALTQGGGAKVAADMAKGGGFKVPTAISEQLGVELELAQDDQTEEQIKAIIGKAGSAINAAKPDEHGLNDTMKTGTDIPGVGDWAFTTNVAAVNMGAGLSTRGRLLEARKGPWHITVSVTIAPDPGEAKLDDELAAVARGAIAKMK